MEYKSSFERINNVKSIEYISRMICNDYKLGYYQGYKIIDTGYEDFNYYLYAGDKQYVVKIFNVERDNSSCERLIDILLKSYINNVPVPKIFQCNGENIYDINVDGTALKLFVMDNVGKDFWELNRPLTKQELSEVARIAALINKIDYDIDEVFYDEWTITNLIEEFNKKKDSLSEEDYEIVSKVVEDFSKVDMSSFKHSYIHGDMIKANLILDDSNKIHVIDFSAFNYLPRIIEVTAILLGLCLTNQRDSTIELMNYFINEYNSYNQLEKNEIDILPLMIKALASMYVIQSSFIRSNSGDYTENDYWYSEGVKCLKMKIKSSDFKINK